MRVDINCDMAESDDPKRDAALMPMITSCNVACGGHAGESRIIEATIRLAIDQGVAVGAHPSYPDRAGFGRRRLEMPLTELKAALESQIASVKRTTERLGGRLTHVKPHGALYNVAADSECESRCVLEAVQTVGQELKLVGLAGSVAESVAHAMGHPFVPEAFADRRYTVRGRLVSRSEPGAVIEAPEIAAAQVISIVQDGLVVADGQRVAVDAQSICVHGDNPAAPAILAAIDRVLAENGIGKACL